MAAQELKEFVSCCCSSELVLECCHPGELCFLRERSNKHSISTAMRENRPCPEVVLSPAVPITGSEAAGERGLIWALRDKRCFKSRSIPSQTTPMATDQEKRHKTCQAPHLSSPLDITDLGV